MRRLRTDSRYYSYMSLVKLVFSFYLFIFSTILIPFINFPLKGSISGHLHIGPFVSLTDCSPLYTECRLAPCFDQNPAYPM